MVHDVQFSRAPGLFGFGGRAHAPGDSRLAVASAEREVAGTLSIVTKEGDTVTLSADFDASVTYARTGRGHHGAQVTSASVSSSLSLEVKGDLNADELAEIRQVVTRFMHDLRAMVRGRDRSIADVATLDASTLQSVSATATETNDVTLIGAVSFGRRNVPTPLPLPAVPVESGTDVSTSPANPALSAAEDADLLPA